MGAWQGAEGMGTRGRRSDHTPSPAALWISSQASAAVLWFRRLGPEATTSRKPSRLPFTSELLSSHLFFLPSKHLRLHAVETYALGRPDSESDKVGLNPGLTIPLLIHAFIRSFI